MRTQDKPVQRPWSVPIAVADIPDTGHHVDLVADTATRDAVAKVVGVVAVPKLEASFELTRQGHDRVHVIGRVHANVTQSCVVTLDPVDSEVDESIDLVFASQPAAAPEHGSGSHAVDAEEPPEMLRDGMVDVGAVATEFLTLGIHPYPRKPGVVFDAPPAGDPSSHPFAALAALKKGGSSEGHG